MASSAKQQEERTVHGVTWKDDLAWMEPMKGADWDTFVNLEGDKWSSLTQSLDTRSSQYQIKKELAVSSQKRFVSGPVQLGHLGTMAYSWKWDSAAKEDDSIIADLYERDGYVWTSSEDSSVVGAEVYVISMYKKGSVKPTWTRRGMSPFVGVLGDRCYSLEMKNKLIYYRLLSWNCYTGKDMKIHYVESDKRYNLEIVRGENCIWVRRQSGPKQDVFEITEKSVKLLEGISIDSRRFVFGSKCQEYLVWNLLEGWNASNTLSKLCKLPRFGDSQTPEHLDTDRGLLVTKSYGTRTLWRLFKDKEPLILWKGIGNILADPWKGDWIRVTIPGRSAVWIEWKESPLHFPKPNFFASEWLAMSSDGASIPFVLVGSKTPKALVVVGYSAYGIPTGFSTARWTPLLKDGWAIAFGMYRGGGDHTPEWEDDGRLKGRETVLEDAEAVVRQARHVTGVPAEKCVVYGRSAGGLWVGGLCGRFPKGDLFGVAYMEVPYLDVLRTTTNPSLPLTNLETDEFGLPEQRLSDFASMMKWSPMEMIGAQGTPGIKQIVRTGLNDPQVFAYESAKWVTRCRGLSQKHNNRNIYLAIQRGQGHFVQGSTGLEQQAEDISVLNEFIKNRRE